jgi:uncharacterized repeat protein (TIGR03806 family)
MFKATLALAVAALGLSLAPASTALAQDSVPLSLAPSGPVGDSDPEFSWKAAPGATHYRINVRNAANRVVFNQWYASSETACGADEEICRLRSGREFTPASYRWKVIAKDASKALSGWSPWLVFFPGMEAVPGAPPAPQPGLPSGDVSTTRPVFDWSPGADVSHYRLQVRTDDGEVVLNRWRALAPLGCSDGVGECSYRAPVALASGSYRWRLLAKNVLSGGRSQWSEDQAFDVPTGDHAGSGLDSRPANPSCRLREAPPETTGVSIERVYKKLALQDVVILRSSPQGGDWIAVGKDGRVLRFNASDQNGSSLATVIDISDRVVNDTGETGLLGMAFHPQFPLSNKAYLFYTDLVDGEYRSHLSEFQSPDGGITLDASSERRLLTLAGHATHNHKAGTIAFGPEGYLYLSLGDGGAPPESQDPFNWFGTLLRIDIDGGEPYSIPPDNPFADGIRGAPEVYAYGFRNPWRWSIDRQSGLIWLTDVGLSSWEEINLVEPGANYGWPIYEGPQCAIPGRCSEEGLTPPLFAYPHDETGGYVVVGGFVYHGDSLPGLQGRFVYADGTDRVWALFFDEHGEPDPVLLIDGGMSGGTLRSMFEAKDGELYLVKGGLIYKLVPDRGDSGDYVFPTALSQTGCVNPDEPAEVTGGLIPYDVNSAFWTDGAGKHRWLALPDRDTIALNSDGDFEFPPGSVLVKEFSLSGKRIETRLFARHDDGSWAGYSYAWNEDESDAFLVGRAGIEIDLGDRKYTIPSRNQCMACHTEAGGWTLGLEIRQQNREFEYPSTGRVANQLTTFDYIGLFEDRLPDATTNLGAFSAIDDASASFQERGRSYLHSNCSSCHQPDGGGRGPADLRYQPLEQMHICDVPPEVGDLGIEGARLLAPGDPERSIISVRMRSLGPDGMPPIGKNRVDIDATAVMDEFISGVTSCGDSPERWHASDWHAD